MKFIVLAVTKSYDGFCVAGMNEMGEWIRPISLNSPGRFWSKEELLINGRFTRSGDMWEISGQAPIRFQYPNHTEDFEITERSILPSLSTSQLQNFLDQHCEDERALTDVFSANRRSICLVEADGFVHYNTNYDGKPKARMIFSSKKLNLKNPHTKDDNIIVKDCKWEGLLLSATQLPRKYEKIYVCIGLATPTRFDGVEYPQVIGLHTLPNVSETQRYPD